MSESKTARDGDHARDITIEKYTLALIWPVVLRGLPRGQDGESRPLVSEWADWFVKHAGWNDPLKEFSDTAVPPIPDVYSYAEIVYFHPFVRDFLFGDGGTKKRDLSTRFLTRNDVQSVTVEVLQAEKKDADGETILDDLQKPVIETIHQTFAVTRLQLHIMKPCVALLTLEISAVGKTLHELMQFQDRFRRIYPPYWAGDEPGLCVRKVEWSDRHGKPICTSDVPDQKAQLEAFPRAGGEPPVCAHWQFFFGSLQPLQTRKQLDSSDDQVNGKLCYQQLTDERIQTMSYFAVGDPRRISEGDLYRLTFVDDAADRVDGKWVSNTYAYNPAFLECTRDSYRYERFSHYGTTYLACGYGFTVVGKSDWFFTDIVHGHFRHHYFRMGLLAHYQRAALLYFGDELSNAIKDLVGEGPHQELQNEKFRKHVEEIQMGFLKFRSRAFFPEVSNQLQAQELWKFWVDHLNTKVLFEQVDGTSHRLTDVLAESETRHLTRFATFGVPIALILSVLSVFASFASQDKWEVTHWDWSLGLGGVLVLFAGTFLGQQGYLGSRISRVINSTHC